MMLIVHITQNKDLGGGGCGCSDIHACVDKKTHKKGIFLRPRWGRKNEETCVFAT